MLVPTDTDVDLPATLVVVSPALVAAEARLVRVSGDRIHLRTSAPPPPLGARVIVTVGERDRIHGRVMATDDLGGIDVSRDGEHTGDDRAAPRVVGHCGVRWRVLAEGAPTVPWLNGEPDPGSFVVHVGPTDLSVAGIQLPPGDAATPNGTRLLIEIDLGDRLPIRGIGQVRRQLPTGSVGADFVDLTDEASDRLSAFTLAHL